MFHKLISNLPYQPASLGNLAFYLRRVRQEESIRRLGFILIALVFLLQLFSVVYPSKPSLATSTNDIVYGASSKDQVMRAYINNKDGLGRNDIRKIYDHYGIGTDQIAAANYQKIGSRQRLFISTGRGTSPGVDSFISIPGVINGGIFQRSLKVWDINAKENWYGTITGMSKFGFRFWIILDGCGNIVFEQGSILPNLEIKKLRKSSFEVNPSDKINYQIQFRNTGPGIAKDVKIKDTIADEFSYLSYSSNIDLKLNKNGNKLSWHIANSKSELAPSHKWYFINLHLQAKNINSTQKICNSASISANGIPTINSDDPVMDRCVKIIPPVLSCQSIKIAESPNWDTRKFITTISLEDGAQAKQINYFIDNKIVHSEIFVSGSNTQFFTYKFPGEGTYKIYAELVANNGTVKSGYNCQLTEIISKPKDPEPQISTDKSVSNLTQNIKDANNTTAKPGDLIKYTLHIYNNGEAPAVNLDLDGEYGESINDILEYSDLIDKEDAIFNEQTNFLSWEPFTIPAGDSIQKSFTVKVKDPLPLTPTSASDPLSYDFNMQNVYGRQVVVRLDKPPSKTLEQTVSMLPNTGPGSSVIIGFIAVSIVAYFFYRSRLIANEIEIAHEQYSGGNI